MKKAMTLALAVLLALSCCVPALAAEEEYAAYEAAHPEELAALDAQALLAGWDYRDRTAEEWFMAYRDEATLEEAVKREYIEKRLLVEEISGYAEEYRAEFPEEWAAFDPDRYFSEDYNEDGGYEDKADYMACWNILTDAEFADDMFVFYINGLDDGEDEYDWEDEYDYDYNWEDEEEPRPAPRLVVNGEVVTDAGFQTEDGVSYVASAWLDGALGTSYAGGEAGPEAPPEGYYMVPLRQAAEAAGWDVGWNEEENAVYLLDQDALKEGLRGDMAALETILTWSLEHSQTQPGRSEQTTQTCVFTLTLLNSLDGDEDYTVDVTVETLARDGVVNCTLTVDAADLLRLVGQELWDAAARELPQLTLQDLKTLLGGVRVNLIADLTTGTFSVNCPILSAFDETISEDSWYTASAGADLRTDPAEAAGAVIDYLVEDIYGDLEEDSGLWWSSPEEAFATFSENRGDFAAFFGSDTLTQTKGGVTWSVTIDRINDRYAQRAGAEVRAFQAFDIRVTLGTDGSCAVDGSVRPDMEGIMLALYASGEYGDYDDTLLELLDTLSDRSGAANDFRLTIHGNGTPEEAAVTVDYHQKNAFKLQVESRARRRQTDALPLSQPPAGAVLAAL